MRFAPSCPSAITLVAPVLALAACSSAPPAPSPAEPNTAKETLALDSPNGGLDLTSKEAPAFGDPEVEALPLMETPPAPPSPIKIAIANPIPGEGEYRVLLWEVTFRRRTTRRASTRRRSRRRGPARPA